MSFFGLLLGAVLGDALGKGIGKQINISNYRSMDSKVKAIEASYNRKHSHRMAHAAPWNPGYVECRLRTNYVRQQYGEPLLSIMEAVKQRISMANKIPAYEITEQDEIIGCILRMKGNGRVPVAQGGKTIADDDIKPMDVRMAVRKWSAANPWYEVAWNDCDNP